MRRGVLLPLSLVLALLIPGPSRAQEDPTQADTRTVYVELILDASGSMAETLASGETRMDAAHRVLRRVIEGLPERDGINVGLRVYGHKGDNTEATKTESCRASELLVPIAGLDKAELIRQVEAIQPTGWTPIAYSLQQAAADFRPGGESITNAIVLVTDGEERCDPPEQACAAAAALRESDVTVTTHVVGFALTPQQTELVRCVAEEGGGQLFGADDAEGLSSALGAALAGVGIEPVTPPSTPPPLTDVRTLAYHQLTAWSAGPDHSSGGVQETMPVLGDDGRRIVFARAPGTMDPATPNRIFVVEADGSGEREVDAYASLCFCGATVDVSADGSRVVSTDLVQLRIADAGGGGGRELIALDSNEINALRISGDGRTVFFRIARDATIRGSSPSQAIERGIYVVNADGSGLRQIVGPAQLASLLGVPVDQLPFFSASWGLDASTDGSRVVFATYTADVDPAAGSVRDGLFAVNGDGSGLRRLLEPTFTFVINGAISGDGTAVAFVTQAAAAANLQEAGVIGFDGGERRVLTDSNTLHPGTGANLPGTGDRIQLSFDGARLLLGSTGTLYDTAEGGRIALGVAAPGFSGDPTPLVGDGHFRATMDAGATRILYLFQPFGEPFQLARVDLNPADLGAAPSVAEPRVDPTFALTESRSTATVSARVGTTHPFLRVSARVLRDALPDVNVYTSPLADDGATVGDTVANDGLFTNNAIYTDCCAPVGPRTVRLKAEIQAADGLRHATAVDVTPFAVVADAADAPAQPTAPAAPTTPPTPEPTQAPAVPPSPAPGTATSAPADDFITPDPAECTVTPRTAEEIEALAASPDPDAAETLATAVATPGLTMPPGQPADAATVAAVVDTFRQFTACLDAGNTLAAYALWTDDALRQVVVQAPSGSPTPVPKEHRAAFRVGSVQVLADGRVAAVLEQRFPLFSAAAVYILVQQDGRYLIDETVDADVTGSA